MPEKPMTGFQRWLDALPTTNMKLFVAMLLIVAVVVVDLAGGGIVAGWAIQHPATPVTIPEFAFHVVTAAHWLVAGYAGIGAAQFVGKRLTYAAPSPDSERADVPAQPAPASPTASTAAAAVKQVTSAAPGGPTDSPSAPIVSTDHPMVAALSRPTFDPGA